VKNPALKLYLAFVRKHWLLFLLGTLAMLITSTSEVLAPKFIQWALDTITSSDHREAVPSSLFRADKHENLHFLVYLLVINALIAAPCRMAWRQTLARTTWLAGRDLRLRFWGALRYQPTRIFHRFPLGDLMNRATGDLNAARFIHGFTIVLTYDIIFFSLFAIISMLIINVPLTLMGLVVLIFLPWPMSRLGIKEHDLHGRAQVRLSKLSDLIAQCLSTIRMQRATASEDLWQTRLKKEAQVYAQRRFWVLWTGWKIYPLGALPTVIAYAVLLFAGIPMISAGDITVGEFVALQSYIFLLQRPLFDLGDCISEWQKGIASMKRVAEIVSLEAPVPQAALGPAALVAPPPVVALRDFTFRYPDGDRDVLKDVNLTIGAGERVGITGEIGSGKTTLFYALSGLLEMPTTAAADIFGVPVVSCSRQFFAQNVALVLQKTFLFAASIRENLVLEQDVDEARVWDALHTVCMDKEVKRFAGGLDAVIGEWGLNLSGGQRQRLALARILLRPKPLILLDDCLSAVDAVTEELILSRLEKHFHEATIVWAAHRLSTLKLCQRVYQLKDQGLHLITDKRSWKTK